MRGWPPILLTKLWRKTVYYQAWKGRGNYHWKISTKASPQITAFGPFSPFTSNPFSSSACLHLHFQVRALLGAGVLFSVLLSCWSVCWCEGQPVPNSMFSSQVQCVVGKAGQWKGHSQWAACLQSVSLEAEVVSKHMGMGLATQLVLDSAPGTHAQNSWQHPGDKNMLRLGHGIIVGTKTRFDLKWPSPRVICDLK